MSEINNIFEHSSAYERRKDTWIECLKWALKISGDEHPDVISEMIEQELEAVKNE